MVIQFLLPVAGIAGGVKVVYEYANYLQDQGHTVRVIYPGVLFPDPDSSAWRLEAPVRSLKYKLERLAGRNEGKAWFPMRVPLLHVPSLEERYIPDADITVATGNETADWTAKLPKRCGTAFYFIQGYEIWSRDEKTVRATYRLPLKKIVIARFLEAIVRSEGQEVCGIAPNGVNPAVFYGEHAAFKNPPRVLMLSHDAPQKGVADGFEALALARKQMPGIRLAMFGAGPPRDDMPEGTDYRRAPDPESLRRLYQESDVFISPSWEEAWGLPAMEAMACGGAVIATDAGGVSDFATDGVTALLVPPKEPAALAAALLKLLGDQELAFKLGRAAQAEVLARFTLDKACENFESLLLANR